MIDSSGQMLEGNFGELFEGSATDAELRSLRAQDQESRAAQLFKRVEAVRREIVQVELAFDTDLQELRERTLAAQRAEHDRLQRQILDPLSRGVVELISGGCTELELLVTQARDLDGAAGLGGQLVRDGDLVIQRRKDLSDQVKAITKERDDWAFSVERVLDGCDPS